MNYNVYNINEYEWTNIYIVIMYLLKDKNTIENIKFNTKNTLIFYTHKKYGSRCVSIREDTDLDRIIYAIDNDGDDDYVYDKMGER